MKKKRTKIVATLGPSTDSPQVLEKIINSGAEILRINLSHGTNSDHIKRIKLARKIAAKSNTHIAIMLDLHGPKIRIESFLDGSVYLEEGSIFILDKNIDPKKGSVDGVCVLYENLTQDVSIGDTLLLNDGLIVIEVLKINGTAIHCKIIQGGLLSDRKGLNKSGGGLSVGTITKQDEKGIKLACSEEVDYIAVSFVKSEKDIIRARELVKQNKGFAHIIAKIERTEAVENIHKIIDSSDAIMVARGDLAVEVGYASMTSLQKKLIKLAKEHNKVSITATQMFESMITNSSPTRAEVSDVANAVMDGTDAVMLSAESAVGSYPEAAVSKMSEVIIGAEKHESFKKLKDYRINAKFENIDESIAMAAIYIANHLNIKAIVSLTESGSTTLWMSRLRSEIPILAFTRHLATVRKVLLYRGVYPQFIDIVGNRNLNSIDDLISEVLMNEDIASPGDLVLCTFGDLRGISGRTNSIKILEIRNTES